MEPNNKITVTIGVFSGHPNPEVSLDAGAVQKLVELVKTTRGGKASAPPPPPRLGYYYGFFVKVPQEVAKREGLPAEFAIYNGVVSEGKGRERRHWRDTGHIERFLLERAREQGYNELLETVGGDELE
jgi:ABC-type amino acid transport substrate-binding protein